METKTPKFDALLDEILESLVPHRRVCKWQGEHKYCEGKFDITKEDIEFLKMLRVPAPNYCPTCRRMNRFAFVNSINLYKRDNNAPGKGNKIISFVPPASPLIVYDLDSYIKNFDSYEYSTIYDESKTFFDQFWSLRLKVPQPAIIRDPSSINSEYSINGRDLKNGYYVSGGWRSENLWYCNTVTDSRNVMDSLFVNFGENSYEIVSCEKCYNSKYLYFSDNCINSNFLYDCNNCTDCFCCVNIRNKSNCIFNVQYTKEEYKKQISEINLKSRKSINEIKTEFWDFVKLQPIRAERHERVKNVSGTNIADSKDCHDVFDTVKSTHILHCGNVIANHDSMDANVSGGSERLYNTIAVGSKSSNVKFSFASKFITESEFLINCRNVNNCFACIGLDNKNYCIFNRQYEKDEYYKELDKVKYSFLEKGEYGDFFPLSFSTFAYNGSTSDFIFPLNKEEVDKVDGLWQSETESNAVGMDLVASEDIPDNIDDVDNSILSKALVCKETGKPFRITESELEFYRVHSIPLPDIHQIKRIKDRYKYLGNYRMNSDICNMCRKNIITMYNSKDGWNLYCDDCYKREIL
ncbi:MAG: hypothetical protein WC241_00460 [Candidatus Paceibacterota bacterium]|jgi:hypothetical protein